ncbi:nucleoporin p58/p45 isoform X1 [Gadus morhua]|uniref:nucleoporin p58/p45 isoform X1 n=1 Tax=Gadus morhua TaxID=8049 RepID=UPI0011B71B77|nr:nucleoporin p58/p45 isoform X1 [Gadus morhua]
MSSFNFGSTTIGAPAAGGGFAFGGATSAPAPAANAGFSFGNALGAASAAPAAAATATPALSLFGQKPTGGFSFSTPAAGAVAPTVGLTLGAPAAATATTGFSLAFNKPAASAGPFSLTAATTAAAPASTGLMLGSMLGSMAPQQQQPAISGFGMGLGGIAASSAAPAGFSLGNSLFANAGAGMGQTTLGGAGLTLGSLVAPQAAAPALSMGLGGVDFSTSSEKKNDKSSGANPQDSKALKDENLPPIICQDVENFQKFVKEQKQVQEDISRMSSKSMGKVQEDIKSLKQLLSVSASGLQRQALAIEKLKMETAQELKNADIALRTQKIPPGLQHENTAPADYFRCLVEQFEVQLQQYRRQIEELENHLTTQGSGSHITPQDLSMAMQKLYQTFVAQAAQLQSVHENVKILKHQYLSYRRAFLEDSTDVFESKRASNRKWQSTPRLTTGPAPFSSVPNAAAVAMAATLTQQQQPAPGSQAPLGAGFGNPFASGVGTNLGSSSLGGYGGGPGFGGVGTGGSTFGFSTSKPTGGSLSAGFGSSNTSGFNFSSPGLNASAGLTFGVSNPPAVGFGTPGALQLKKPPVGNKRGKR